MNSLIYVSNPDPSLQEEQEAYLSEQEQESRPHVARIINFANATARYYDLATPNEELYYDWLEQFDEDSQRELEELGGYEAHLNTQPFLRFVNEQILGLGLEAYLQKILTEEDWKQLTNQTNGSN